MKNNTFVSVIIPAYNEEKRIAPTLLDMERYFKDKDYNYEIIVVDDGSTDKTIEVAYSYKKRIKGLIVISNGKNRGKGYSVKNGMLSAKGKYRLFMDADNSVKIDNLDLFLHYCKRGDDVVIGSIKVDGSVVKEGNGWHRRFLGDISKRFVRLVAVSGVADTQRGFKLFSKKAADQIFKEQTINRFGFDMELLILAKRFGFKIKELPVEWDNPEGSKVTLMSYVNSFVELIKIKLNMLFGVYSEPENKELETKDFLRKLKNKFESYDQNEHIVYFSDSQKKIKGKGFFYRDREFVHHTDLHHTETAAYVLTHYQKFIISTSILLFILFLVLDWHLTVLVFLAVLTFLYFFNLLFDFFLIYRSFLRSPELKVSEKEIEKLKDDELPVYTIFCPLYKEWQVVNQFSEAMSKLDYPKEKLQVMFLLEEDDEETIEKVKSFDLPSNFDVVVVPDSKPKTKPKAMNYGLYHAKGDYMVIYDAEDVPEPDQLKKAVIAFKKAGKKTVCIQAKLNFYNPNQNLLTRLFTSEYSLWFDLVLPGLQSMNAPIPLGGTSNHFKIEKIRELNGWDAFNVTEDCDLGIRLAKRGFKTAIVDSTTYEEANSDYINWYRQRSRWIKGYIQTYLVHMRDPKEFLRSENKHHLGIFQLTVGAKILSMFINPFMWIITASYFLLRPYVGELIESFYPDPILYLGVFSLVFGNFLYLYYYMVGCAKREFYGLIKYAFLVPLYWIGMSIAAWKAMYEIVVKPHYWQKTVHGLHLKSEQKEFTVH